MKIFNAVAKAITTFLFHLFLAIVTYIVTVICVSPIVTLFLMVFNIITKTLPSMFIGHFWSIVLVIAIPFFIGAMLYIDIKVMKMTKQTLNEKALEKANKMLNKNK